MQVVAVQLLSHVRFFVTPWSAAHWASLPLTISRSFAQVHVRWISDSIQPSHSRAGLSDSKACAHDHEHGRGKGRSHVIQEAKNKLLFFSRVLPQQDWWQDHICVAFSCSAIETLQAWPPFHKSLHILLQTPSTQKLGQNQWVQEPSYV